MKKVQQGFTLIELMIVVAIIGILAAIAIPAYQDYIARSQVTRVVGEMSAMKTAIEESLNRGIYTDAAPAGLANMSLVEIGYTQSDLLAAAPVLTFASANAGAGTFVGTAGNAASSVVNGAIFTLNRQANGQWNCVITNKTDGVNGWKDSYAPTGCPVS
jgi:type IV pilus assembly protein PilA